MSTIAEKDLDFVQSARDAIRYHRAPGANVLLLSVVGLLIAFVVWANQAEIDEVTKGQGKIIPSTSLQTIQNLEGGILSEVRVGEGDKVEEGDILIRLDDTASDSKYKENLSQSKTLEALMNRHYAEAHGHDEVGFDPKLKASHPDLVERETQLFEKNRNEYANRKTVIETSIALSRQELDLAMPLVERGVVAKTEQIRLEREINELEGKLVDLADQVQSSSMKNYNETKATFEALTESIRGHEDRVHRAVVRSPVTGTVNKVYFTTVGGVIKPGEAIMDIVPKADDLVVQANIQPRDIAFLHPGQHAVVKLTAYDFSIYGGLEGRVEHISADTIFDEVTRQQLYQIRVRNTGKILEDRNGSALPIIPGMVAEVDVLTGRRTILQYLTKPFHRARFNALRER